MRKYLFLLASMSCLTGVSYATDARMSYIDASGNTKYLGMAAAICGVDGKGDPTVCGTNDVATNKFTGLSGDTSYLGYVVPVCSIVDGVPQVCDVTGGEDGADSALILGADGITSQGTWPTTDPLVSGRAWQDNGVMMLSTGSPAKPTFDGSLLNVSAGGQTYTLQSWMGGLNYAAQNASTTANAAQTTADAAQTTANAAIPLTQKGAASGVAALDASGNVTAPILTTGTSATGALTVTSPTASLTGSVSGTTRKWALGRRSQDAYTTLKNYTGSSWTAFTFNDDGTLDSNLGVFANLGADAPFAGTVSAPTITATTSASVPDTSTTDSSTAALNTESAAARFATKADESNFATEDDLAAYLKTSDAATTYAPLASPALTGTATAPTPATTDNSTKIATTAFVNNAFQAVEYSVQGDISTVGSSIQIPFGTSGLYAKFAYTGSGSASMTFYSTSGTLTSVDIRRNSIWGGSGVETFTLDNGSVDTSGVVADSTVYTNSQDSSAYFIRVGGQVYFLTVWASNSGARAFMGVHKMI